MIFITEMVLDINILEGEKTSMDCAYSAMESIIISFFCMVLIVPLTWSYP